MKNNVVILAGGLAAMVTAQDITDCARACLDSMIALAPTLDCGDNTGEDLAKCLCAQANYVYGLNDCSVESCSVPESEQLVQYERRQCQGFGVEWSFLPDVVGGPTPDVSEAVTGAESDRGPEIATSAVADVTSPIDSATVSGIIATITSDGQVHTTLVPIDDASSDIEAPTQTGSETSSTGSAEGDEATESANPSASGAEGEDDDSPAVRIMAPAVGFIVAAGIAAILL